ncbi:MAG: hypothetical protein ACYCV4_05455 [Dermatophilaceae bacterium]
MAKTSKPSSAPPPEEIPLAAGSRTGGGGNFFTNKLGPLPVWGWTAIGAAVIGVWWWRSRKTSTSSTGSTASGTGSAANYSGCACADGSIPDAAGNCADGSAADCSAGISGSGYGGGYGSGGGFGGYSPTSGLGSQSGAVGPGWNPSGQPNQPATSGTSLSGPPTGYAQASSFAEAINAARNGASVLYRNNTTGQIGSFNPGSGTTPPGATIFIPVNANTSAPAIISKLTVPTGYSQASSFKAAQAANAAHPGSVKYRTPSGRIGVWNPKAGGAPKGSSLFTRG